MERWGLNAALSWHMARRLRGTVRARLPGAAARVAGCRSVRAFDAAFTAPHFGFPSPDAYYRAASLRPRLAQVARPLLCLCAADDPFQPMDVLPVREAAGSAHVALCVTARGGHIGFLEGLWPARRAHGQYVARLAEQYFAALLPSYTGPSDTPDAPQPSAATHQKGAHPSPQQDTTQHSPQHTIIQNGIDDPALASHMPLPSTLHTVAGS